MKKASCTPGRKSKAPGFGAEKAFNRQVVQGLLSQNENSSRTTDSRVRLQTKVGVAARKVVKAAYNLAGFEGLQAVNDIY